MSDLLRDTSNEPLETTATSPMIEKINALLESYPLASLLPYETFEQETGLYFNKSSTGFVLGAEPLTGASEETIRILSSLITDNLPEHASLQFLIFASPLLEEPFHNWQQQRKEASDIHQTLARKRVEHLNQGRFVSLTKNNVYLIRNFKVVISCTLPGHLKSIELERFLNFREGFITSLKSLGMPTWNMLPPLLIGFLDEVVNPSLHKKTENYRWDEQQSLSAQITSSETSLQVSPTGLTFNESGWAVRTFSVREYPSHFAHWGMNDLIGDAFNDKLSIPCPFLLSFSIYKPREEEMNRRMTFKNARATQQAASPLARFMPLVLKTEADWKYATHAVEEGQKFVKGMFQAVLYSPISKADEAEFALRSLFTAKGWKITKDNYLSLQSWLAALPMMVGEEMVRDLDKFGRLKTFLTNGAANLTPLLGEWKGSSTPRMLLLGRRGQV